MIQLGNLLLQSVVEMCRDDMEHLTDQLMEEDPPAFDEEFGMVLFPNWYGFVEQYDQEDPGTIQPAILSKGPKYGATSPHHLILRKEKSGLGRLMEELNR